jgi:transglutaminase-like putative cysteine protease
MARNALDELIVSGDPVRYQVTMEPTRQQWVFALDIPVDWPRRDIFMEPELQLAKAQPIDQRLAYDVVSYPRYVIDSDIASYRPSRYSKLPNSNPRTTELAMDMRRDAGDDVSYVEAVLAKFHNEEYFYTLQPPPLGRDPVDRFLFDTRRGFCEHYASAFAVMMRAASIPSRIVLGYQGGELNPLGGHLIVRQSDAHAWTEIWLPNRGWHRVDPTAAVAPQRIEAGISGAMLSGIGASWGLNTPIAFFHHIGLTWDALNAKWNDWILGYGPDKQESFLEWLGMEEPDWRKMMLTLTVLVGVIIGIISLVLMMRYRPPPKDQAAILYRKFTRKAGIQPNIGETPQAFAIRLGEHKKEVAADAEEVTEQYLIARYASPDPAAIQNLKSAVDAFNM